MEAILLSDKNITKKIIKEIWSQNLDEEISKIINMIDSYKNKKIYVSMDTEFPGIVYASKNNHNYKCLDENYKNLKKNVDKLKIIQLGLSIKILDDNYNSYHDNYYYQFNFKFDLDNKKNYSFNEESIDLLKNSGINFDEHKINGIDSHEFSEKVMMSGLFFQENITWIVFSGSYDFGYLCKMLLGSDLPENINDFLDYIQLIFVNFYDIKFLISYNFFINNDFKKSLLGTAEHFNIKINKNQHQAGIDSILTEETFFQMCKKEFNGLENFLELKNIKNKIYNLHNLKD